MRIIVLELREGMRMFCDFGPGYDSSKFGIFIGFSNIVGQNQSGVAYAQNMLIHIKARLCFQNPECTFRVT